MKIDRKTLQTKKAIFPAVMTVISFISFLVVYCLLTYQAIHPFYFTGLLFTLPFILFGLLTYITARGKIGGFASTIITIIFSIALTIGASYLLVYLSFQSATTQTNDVGKYERILRLTKDSLTEYFPEEIPEHTKNVDLSYRPAFVQGGEKFRLKFQSDSQNIQDYQRSFLADAKKVGNVIDIQKQEDTIFDFAGLSNDFVVYIFVSEPSQPNNWNHGEYSFAAINEENQELIFMMEDW